jgi:hypothetical protein
VIIRFIFSLEISFLVLGIHVCQGCPPFPSFRFLLDCNGFGFPCDFSFFFFSEEGSEAGQLFFGGGGVGCGWLG